MNLWNAASLNLAAFGQTLYLLHSMVTPGGIKKKKKKKTILLDEVDHRAAYVDSKQRAKLASSN
jgi:hypothetical protein